MKLFTPCRETRNMGIGLIALSTLLLTGCQDDTIPDSGKKVDFNPLVSFTLTLSDHHDISRADQDGDINDPFPDDKWENPSSTDYGTDFDRKVNTLIPVLYSVNADGLLETSSPAGTMTDAVYDRDNTTGTLTVTGKLNTSYTVENLEKGQFRLAVFINTPEIDITDPGASSFMIHGVPGSEMEGIPMYGVGEASFAGLSSEPANSERPFPIKTRAGSDENLEIPILRSMAKIRVKVRQELFEKRQMRLQSFGIDHHAKQGFIVPSKWNSISKVTLLGLGESMNALTGGSFDDDYRHSCHVEPSVEANTDSRNSWTMLRFYIPDTYNFRHDGISETTELTLKVSYLSDGEETPKTHEILFRPYKNGQPDMTAAPWDIVRNHIYEYTITGIEPKTGQLQVTVESSWWGYHNLELE